MSGSKACDTVHSRALDDHIYLYTIPEPKVIRGGARQLR